MMQCTQKIYGQCGLHFSWQCCSMLFFCIAIYCVSVLSLHIESTNSMINNYVTVSRYCSSPCFNFCWQYSFQERPTKFLTTLSWSLLFANTSVLKLAIVAHFTLTVAWSMVILRCINWLKLSIYKQTQPLN